MTDKVPSWLKTMRDITGTLEAPGSADNPVILAWRDEIASRFPDMASYCAEYTHDSIAWCGLTVAYCMAHNGIRPIFGPADTDKFLFAQAWTQFGAAVDDPQLGDVLVFAHHVTLYDGEDGNFYLGRGGNQSDGVRVSHYAKVDCEAARRPPLPTPSDQLWTAPIPISSTKRLTAITATVFGGQSDPNTSAYDNHFITDDELGVALPARIEDPRPTVRVFKGSKSVICNIVDIGPWNTNDPYWATGTRPQAESGIDRTGRHTNRAGIDLTPAAARAVGIDGKGTVDWEFAETLQPGPTTPVTARDPTIVKYKQLIEQLLTMIEPVTTSTPTPAPTPAPSHANLATVIQQTIALIKTIETVRSQPADSTPPQSNDQIQDFINLLAALAHLASGKSRDPSQATLGPVNGALGQTFGKLLDGKKTAIGTIGALLTALVANVPAGTAVADILAKITPYAMPIFLALAAWGVLGKFEKWAHNTPPPPSS
jgi:uncharacterized protein (TIGR02594 family)